MAIETERRNDPIYCPVEITESLLRYWHHREPTGGFLYAVLTNNLTGACHAADDTNIRHLPGIVSFCWWQLPALAWGSPAKVRAWLMREDEKRDDVTPTEEG